MLQRVAFYVALCHLSQNPTCIQFHCSFDYRQAVLCLAEGRQLPEPTFVWQLPTEGFKLEQMNSNLMVKWLKQAAKKATLALPEGLTSRCYRIGAATAAKILGVETVSLCQLADWDEDGMTFRKMYWRSTLECTLLLQRRIFGDLLE
jgi:hypothetical protein